MCNLSSKDYVSREELAALQLTRMRGELERVYQNVPFYKESFDAAGVKPSDLRSLDELRLFPFTMKKDLREHYPFGLLAVPKRELVRIHASSGTTGKPTVVCYTRNDIVNWSETGCRALQMADLTEEDVIQNSYGYGLFTGGLGAHYGIERLGASVVPASGGATDKQLMLMKDFGVTAICCTPSFFIHMIEEAEKQGIELKNGALKVGFFGAEPWTEEMRQFIQEHTGIEAFDIFGLSEIMGPGVACDCHQHNGMHIFEDHYYPEIIDSDTGEVKGPGEEGELVFTNLTKEGMPLIRYRTRDISTLHYETCGCGRTLVRMEKVRRRSDDMLIIRGVNLFPGQVESVLLNIKGLNPFYQIVVSRKGAMDELEIKVELQPEYIIDGVSELERLRGVISGKIKEVIGLSARVTLVEPGELERSAGKSKRVLDLRQK